MRAAGARVSADGAHKSAYGLGGDWETATRACLQALDPVPAQAGLGLVYVTDHLAADLPKITERLREETGVEHWCGTVALGIAAPGLEIFDEPALSVLLLSLPPDSFQVLPPSGADMDLPSDIAAWLSGNAGATGIIHADPRTPELAEVVASLAELHQVRLAGGLSASRAAQAQVSGSVAMGERAVLGISGALFAPNLGLEVGLTQGCSPLGPIRQATAAEGRLLSSIDGRPALTVLAEDVGASLDEDPRPHLDGVHLSLPVPGGDCSDMLVRNIVGIDPVRGIVAVADEVEPGQRLQFVRRDAEAAGGDLERMLTGLLGRMRSRPRAAVYVSCIARGPNLFGRNSRELAHLRAALGEIPLTGFYANGEICNRRLYGYTGVLILFP